MERKYIDGFKTELSKFMLTINELMPSETTEYVLSKFPQLNMMKIITRFYKIMTPLKDKLTKHDPSMFENKLFIVPEFNISFFWENLPQQHQYILSILQRLLIYSNIIMDNSPQSTETTTTTQQSPTQNKQFNPFEGVGGNNVGLSVNSLSQEMDKAGADGNPVLGLLQGKIDKNAITEQLKNVNDE